MPESRLPTITQALVLPLVTVLGGAGAGFRRAVLRDERCAPADRAARQAARLRQLLHAAMNSPLHHERLRAAGLRPDDLRTVADLSRLPLLEKTDLTDTPAEALITRRPRWRHRMRTSGTSGRPVSVQADLRWWARSLARRRVLFARHGLTYGAREGRCWGRPPGAGGPSLKDRLGSRRTFQFAGASASELAAEARALAAFAPAYLYGYPSLVRQAAWVWRDQGLPPLGLAGVVLTGERVAPADRALIGAVFGCPVHREYGCSELDIVAFDCEHGRCHVASDHVVVEAHDPHDGLGECVVTDLDNTLMPLIRYRLGDRIRLAGDLCPCGRTTPVIEAIEGRTGHARYLRLPDGRRLHTVLFSYLMGDLAAGGLSVRQFKVRQTALDRIVIHLDLGAAMEPADLARDLGDLVRERVGHPLAVEVVVSPLVQVPGTKWNYFDPLPEDAPPEPPEQPPTGD